MLLLLLLRHAVSGLHQETSSHYTVALARYRHTAVLWMLLTADGSIDGGSDRNFSCTCQFTFTTALLHYHLLSRTEAAPCIVRQ